MPSDYSVQYGGFFILSLIAFMALLEAFWIRYIRKSTYDWRAALASLAVAIGKRSIEFLTAGVTLGLLFSVYQFRLSTLSINNLLNLLCLFFLLEFFYYWHHRFAHEIRWLWATHSVHHTPQEMNLSVAARLGWTGLLSGSVLFFAPLVWMGYHPIAVLGMLAFSLFYQIWIHTTLIARLPRWIEWCFNTPSHHRVHHASNPVYLDKNYGGVLIIWDRLFGTFVAERESVRYGLTIPMTSHNPLTIAFFEWRRMAKDVYRAKNIRERFHYLFSPPGWSPKRPRKMSPIKIHNPFTKKEALYP